MLGVVLSGFVLALLMLPLGNYLKGKLAIYLAILPIVLFSYFLSLLPQVLNGNHLYYSYNWIPSMGINLDFKLDGLSMLFSLMITGIGSLIFLYASKYLKGHIYLDRFFAYLAMFMAAMLGLVLSDNVFLLFIFWELTSISSFFLIGFNNNNEASRKSSMLALSITGGGGFFLMAGFVLMGNITGTYSIQEMLFSSEILKSNELYGWMLFLVFAGAFTKSAQFPLHFWLPGAMKAPTPVSAYLHSATMVKAGIYLLARFTPVLGNHMYWNTTLMVIGGITMLYAAFHSIFRTDLKAILAYSTISALGILVFLIGIGTEASFVAAAVFIIGHALYKAGLFLTAGVIDHETGSRDVTKIRGLRKVMLPLAIAGLLAALSNAGIPFLLGFIAKDLIYEATLHKAGLAMGLTALAFVTNILLTYSGYLAGVTPFSGKLPAKLEKVHLPHYLMWAPPLLLGVLGLLFGVFPSIVDQALIQPVVLAMRSAATPEPLKIWHGFNTVLLLSGTTIVLGLTFYLLKRPSQIRLQALSKFDFIAPQRILSLLVKRIEIFSFRYTRTLHNGYLRSYLLIIIIFLIGIIGYRLFTTVHIRLDFSKLSPIAFYEAIIVLIMIVAIIKTVFTTSRLVAIASMGVVGLCICLFFVFYGAPDLAMTQFIIDTLTVVLFVLVLFRLPPFLNFSNKRTTIRDGAVSLGFGTLIALIAIQAYNEPVNKEISRFYADNAYVLAKGKNVVNVILVDFRGADTMVEITVLTIAALGVYSMLKLNIKTSEME